MRDAVIAGADRDDIAALVFPDVEACRKLAAQALNAPSAEAVRGLAETFLNGGA